MSGEHTPMIQLVLSVHTEFTNLSVGFYLTLGF